jgi:hypothetical protein
MGQYKKTTKGTIYDISSGVNRLDLNSDAFGVQFRTKQKVIMRQDHISRISLVEVKGETPENGRKSHMQFRMHETELRNQHSFFNSIR